MLFINICIKYLHQNESTSLPDDAVPPVVEEVSSSKWWKYKNPPFHKVLQLYFTKKKFQEKFSKNRENTMKLIKLFLTQQLTTTVSSKLTDEEKQTRNVVFYKKHCVGSPSSRVDCGYPGITATSCAKKKCCWDESVAGVPFCYQGGLRKYFYFF